MNNLNLPEFIIKNKAHMKKTFFTLSVILVFTAQLMAQSSVLTLRTSKIKGDTITLKLVAGGNVSVDLGSGIEVLPNVSKNYSAPTSHILTLQSNMPEIKIYGNNLTYFDCAGNALTALDVSKNTSLRTLKCQNNTLKELNLEYNNDLTLLWCGMNSIQELNLKNMKELVQLSCISNKISALNVSQNTKLNTLICSRNALSQLDVSNNPVLKALKE